MNKKIIVLSVTVLWLFSSCMKENPDDIVTVNIGYNQDVTVNLNQHYSSSVLSIGHTNDVTLNMAYVNTSFEVITFKAIHSNIIDISVGYNNVFIFNNMDINHNNHITFMGHNNTITMDVIGMLHSNNIIFSGNNTMITMNISNALHSNNIVFKGNDNIIYINDSTINIIDNGVNNIIIRE
ncbi:MAG: hypothetical protein FWE37_01515 [Spirochaetaceae bacterium]|nr:hypothetical protein [Spirochaetaceae bacterium]